MNVQWHRHGHRLDVELSVALEAGWRQLLRAHSPRQLDAAIVFNLRLWRIIRSLAKKCPGLDEDGILADTADHVATMLVVDASPCPDPRDVAFVAGRNLALARGLAGEAAAESARTTMMSAWAATNSRDLGDWLLDRLAAAGCPRPIGRSSCPSA